MLMVEQYQVDTELGAEDGHDVEIVQSNYIQKLTLNQNFIIVCMCIAKMVYWRKF